MQGCEPTGSPLRTALKEQFNDLASAWASVPALLVDEIKLEYQSNGTLRSVLTQASTNARTLDDNSLE
jgi:hypothetical protein